MKAKASASFAMATDSNERASERVLSELDGEIEMAKATCFTHSVTIAENVRPVFTQVWQSTISSTHSTMLHIISKINFLSG